MSKETKAVNRKNETEDLTKTENESTVASSISESITRIDGALMKEMIRGGAEELLSNVEEVNGLNVFPVPDGDTGDNMLATVNSAIRAIEELDTDNLSEVMHALSHGMLLGARGNSGVILSQFFKGIADGFKGMESATVKDLASALLNGVKEAYKTVANPVEGTILTVAREAIQNVAAEINPHTTTKSFFADFVKELRTAVERTPELLPTLKEAGVVDSGGAGLFYLIDGFNRVLCGKTRELERERVKHNCKNDKERKTHDSTSKIHENTTAKTHEGSVSENHFSFDKNTNMIFSYCTELLVGLTNAKCSTGEPEIEEIRKFLNTVGDSVATVKSDNVIKIHVHTLTPDKVLQYMLKYGEFINVKIENMSIQHTDFSQNKAQTHKNGAQLFTNNARLEFSSPRLSESSNSFKTKTKRKKYGVVAVSSGNGFSELLRSLGADEIIEVRNGENPSAEDFLKKSEAVYAKQVFIFPNNSNFILSAEQATKMTEGFTTHVIPAKNIALGYAALSVMDFENECTEEIIRSAVKAVNTAKTGSVFIAARDAKCSGIKISEGEIVGAIEKSIVTKGKTIADCSAKICKKLLTGRYMLTVFKGINAKKADMLEIEKRIKKFCPDVEIYSVDSGQEIFEYIFLAE